MNLPAVVPSPSVPKPVPTSDSVSGFWERSLLPSSSLVPRERRALVVKGKIGFLALKEKHHVRTHHEE